MLRRLLLSASLAFVLGACGSAEDDPEEDPIVEPDAGAPAGDPDAGGGDPIEYMESCDGADDVCAAGLVCFQFNSRGPHCTHDCSTSDDCPPPSRGCNNMGVCKAP